MMEKSTSTLTKMFELHELAHDSTYIFPYALVKEAVFQMYLWGEQTDNDDVIAFYKRMLGVWRTYDKKFVKPEVIESRRGKASQES
ncbi:MAG: hypothetical protein OXG92_09935 [Chloroflexi bacterium]|nr:hypothetical protein [Chloroflexota bacterium]MCY3583657.1 hypothetical protein [Chloroflexota bacterium]MCY3716770.1 hypothetical protein [Chloroflexota bacterium]MDE2649137.1 hypothetical protein [Chloroflexota bacterium]